MPKVDPDVAEELKKAGEAFLGQFARIGARAAREAAASVLDELGELGEDAADRARRAAKSVRARVSRRPPPPDDK